jgi:hypothetical protein
VQQVARYQDAALVQQRSAFVASVSQQLADRLQDCRRFMRGEEAELGIKAPAASLPNLPANMKKKTTRAGKKTVTREVDTRTSDT